MSEPLKIYDGEAAVVAPLAARAAGTYEFEVELRGNALVSTVFVDDLDGATITAVWKDTNPLTTDRYVVHTHAAIVAGYNREFIAEATHGVSILVITVTGGTPTFGVFATANQLVGNFASPQSTQKVSGELEVVSIVGTPTAMRTGIQETVPDDTLVMLSEVVPVGKAWKFTNFEGQCRFTGYFTIWVGAVLIAKANTGPASENAPFVFMPYDSAATGETVEIRYTQSYGPAVDVSAFLFFVETDP